MAWRFLAISSTAWEAQQGHVGGGVAGARRALGLAQREGEGGGGEGEAGRSRAHLGIGLVVGAIELGEVLLGGLDQLRGRPRLLVEQEAHFSAAARSGGEPGRAGKDAVKVAWSVRCASARGAHAPRSAMCLALRLWPGCVPPLDVSPWLPRVLSPRPLFLRGVRWLIASRPVFLSSLSLTLRPFIASFASRCSSLTHCVLRAFSHTVRPSTLSHFAPLSRPSIASFTLAPLPMCTASCSFSPSSSFACSFSSSLACSPSPSPSLSFLLRLSLSLSLSLSPSTFFRRSHQNAQRSQEMK